MNSIIQKKDTELTIKIMDLTFIGLMEKNTTNDEPDEAIDN